MLDRLSLFLFSFTTIVFIAVCFTILNKNYLLIKILFVINYAIFIASYVYTVLINPGIPKRDYYIKNFMNKKIDKDQWQNCLKCNILIPKHFKTVHCEDCDICVLEEDHHCPWTGKCIGKYNLISFHIFVNSLCVYFIMIFITFYSFIFYNSFFDRKKKK